MNVAILVIVLGALLTVGAVPDAAALAEAGGRAALGALHPRAPTAPAWLSGILCRHAAAVNRHVAGLAGPDQHG